MFFHLLFFVLFSGNYKSQVLYRNTSVFCYKETKLRLFCKARRMGGTAKPLPLSLAKLCSSCGRKTTRRLLRSQAKKSATETTLEEEAKARIERRRRKKGSSITLLSSIPFTIFFSRL